jgi:hypothetical protein
MVATPNEVAPLLGQFGRDIQTGRVVPAPISVLRASKLSIRFDHRIRFTMEKTVLWNLNRRRQEV